MRTKSVLLALSTVALLTGTAVAQTTCETAVPCCPADMQAPVAHAGADTANIGLLFFVFVLAIFLGVELIAKVPSQLHTPLMSGSNAISGISIVGALLAVGKGSGTTMIVLGTLSVALAMINVVGGYLVTDRMLGMFKHKG